MDWAGWRELPGLGKLDSGVLAELLDGGQSFRWNLVPGQESDWQGVFADVVVQVSMDGDEKVVYRLPDGRDQHSQVQEYFGEGVDWDAIVDRLPWRSDGELGAGMEAFPGLRILRQPFGEVLFAFLCSTAKQIPQIKQCCFNVANRFGPELAEGIHGWPSWAALADVSEEALRECKLGYRAKYVTGVARRLAGEPDFEGRVLEAPYPEAKSLLMSLPGVGEKVADCVLLFGAGKLAAFPVDTWITKAMARMYGLEGWAPSAVAHFGRVHFGEAAGVAQQFLFARERQLSV